MAEPAMTGANGRKPRKAAGTTGKVSVTEAAAEAAAASMAARIERESAPVEPRPQTKAAAKRAKQAANPRKETASERNLREKREAGGPKPE